MKWLNQVISWARRVWPYLKEWMGEVSGYKQGCLDERARADEFNQAWGECRREMVSLASLGQRLQSRIDELEVRYTPPAPPEILGHIDAAEVRAMFLDLFPGQSLKIHLGDLWYCVTTIDEVNRMVEWSKVNELPYIWDQDGVSSHDCDRFAAGLVGDFANSPGWWDLPYFSIWGNLYRGHGFVAVVAYPSENDLTPTLYFIEPQTDVEMSAELVGEMDLWHVSQARKED